MIRSASLCVVLMLPALAQAQQGRILRTTPIFDVWQNGQKGMIIQIDADVDDMAGRQVNFAAFFRFNNGARLRALPGAGRFATPDGQVTTQQKEFPRFNRTRFTNVELFVPYFELTGGIVPLNLMYEVEIQYDNGVRSNALLDRSGATYFTVK
jgi:hypothetical protein